MKGKSLALGGVTKIGHAIAKRPDHDAGGGGGEWFRYLNYEKRLGPNGPGNRQKKKGRERCGGGRCQVLGHQRVRGGSEVVKSGDCKGGKGRETGVEVNQHSK